MTNPEEKRKIKIDCFRNSLSSCVKDESRDNL